MTWVASAAPARRCSAAVMPALRDRDRIVVGVQVAAVDVGVQVAAGAAPAVHWPRRRAGAALPSTVSDQKLWEVSAEEAGVRDRPRLGAIGIDEPAALQAVLLQVAGPVCPDRGREHRHEHVAQVLGAVEGVHRRRRRREGGRTHRGCRGRSAVSADAAWPCRPPGNTRRRPSSPSPSGTRYRPASGPRRSRWCRWSRSAGRSRLESRS